MQTLQSEDLGSALLVHVELPGEQSQEDLEELRRLTESAGAVVAGSVICKRDAPDPAYFIGTGKVEETLAAVNAVSAQTVIFNTGLTPAQERNLERALGCRVIDRIALILTIFAMRARTYEGKLQVELARLQYEQARLVRGWTHLERQKGGFGLRGGPGETQIELDRRALKERIGAIREDLEIVARRREQNRNRRRKNEVPLISFVGYTNAGKSTLFNRLTGSAVYAADQLFATLDPTLRTIELPTIGRCIFADTVGFIRHLPHDLVAAFRGTLEETAQADLLLHVVDAADPRVEENIAAVNEVLKQVGAERVPLVLIYNKSDLVQDSATDTVLGENGKVERVYVSALTGDGLDRLKFAVESMLSVNTCSFTVNIDSSQGKLRSALYAAGAVSRESYDDSGRMTLDIKIKKAQASRIDKQLGGVLGRALGGDKLPWAMDDEFDFDSVE